MTSHSLAQYATTLETAIRQGYAIQCFSNYQPTGKDLLLRHDIDFDPINAANIAEIEHQLGIKTSYYVRLHHNHYNPFGFRVYYHLKKIINYGHEIGLHSENLDFARVMNEDANDVARAEKKVFETIFKTKIRGVSGHRDLVGLHNAKFWEKHKPTDYGFEYNVWDDKFTKNAFMVSDAIGAASEKGVKQVSLEEAIKQNHPKIYATIHPCYWTRRDYLIDSMRA